MWTEEGNPGLSCDDSFKKMIREAEKKKSKNKKKNATKIVADEWLVFQREQSEYEREQDKKFVVMLRESFDEQWKADVVERQKDWDFFQELDKIFGGNSK